MRNISRKTADFQEYYLMNRSSGPAGLPGIRIHSFCHSFLMPNWRPEFKTYPYIQVSIILSGEDCYIDPDGDRVMHRPGFFSISDLNYGGGNSHRRKQTLERYFVMLEVNSLLRSILQELFPSGLPHFMPAQPVKLKRCFEDIRRLLRKKEAADDVSLGAAGFRLLCEAARQLSPAVPIPEKLVSALRHIDNHFCDPLLSRRETAEAAGISVVQLGKLFQEHLHTTVNRYITSMRLKKAVHLLEHVDLPIENIAAQCGFTYAYYFARVFRKHYGLTPAKYRAEHAEKTVRLPA